MTCRRFVICLTNIVCHLAPHRIATRAGVSGPQRYSVTDTKLVNCKMARGSESFHGSEWLVKTPAVLTWRLSCHRLSNTDTWTTNSSPPLVQKQRNSATLSVRYKTFLWIHFIDNVSMCLHRFERGSCNAPRFVWSQHNTSQALSNGSSWGRLLRFGLDIWIRGSTKQTHRMCLIIAACHSAVLLSYNYQMLSLNFKFYKNDTNRTSALLLRWSLVVYIYPSECCSEE